MMKRWISLATILIVIGGAVWSFFYLRDIHPMGSFAARLGGGMDNISMKFEGVRLIGKSDGRKIWTFSADGIDVSRDRQTAIFRGNIRGSLLQNGSPAVGISADEVMYGIYTRGLAIPGEAVVRVIGGPTMRVRKSTWDARQSMVICRGGFQAEVAGGSINGRQMTADLGRKTITMNNVSGSIRLADGE